MGQFDSLVTAVLYYLGNIPDVFPFGLPAFVLAGLISSFFIVHCPIDVEDGELSSQKSNGNVQKVIYENP